MLSVEGGGLSTADWWRLARWAFLAGVLAVLAGWLGRAFVWQQLSADLLCPHCLKVHRWNAVVVTGFQVLGLASLIFLALLPAAATVDEAVSTADVLTRGALVGGIGLLLLLSAGGLADAVRRRLDDACVERRTARASARPS